MAEPKPEYEVPQPKRGRGRPKNGDYPEKVRLRLSTAQLEHLASAAEAEGISVVAYLRRLIDADRGKPD